ncbi:MAG: rhomboid family intramembrane serine protease [Pseudolysinimonas sp.]|uniref:rhomboid family intramembrane serine protease n=1 Tax=Pseudolysinimonas sp. TaxID=2680009 RepID=UPI003264A2EC
MSEPRYGERVPGYVPPSAPATPPTAPPRSGWTRSLRPGGSVVTYVLIGLNLVAYAAQWLSGQALTEAWLLDPSVAGSEPWRLITSAFLHSPTSILHILFNMYALYVFGPMLERFLGRARFLALYLIGALGGSIGVLTLYELDILTHGTLATATDGFLTPISAFGASGAIFALMGALFPLRRAIGVNLYQLVIVLLINLAIGFFAAGIAWEAHVGGLIVGFVIATIYMRTRRPSQGRAQVIGIVAVAAVLLIVFAAFVATSPQSYGL